jgi:hypothetical protein
LQAKAAAGAAEERVCSVEVEASAVKHSRLVDIRQRREALFTSLEHTQAKKKKASYMRYIHIYVCICVCVLRASSPPSGTHRSAFVLVYE